MLRDNYFYSLLLIFSFVRLDGQVPTYHDDIKPILEKHCMNCHHPGEAGPMSLTSYDEVTAYGTMIQYVTSKRLMPPWYADPSYSHFSNERILSDDELKKINDWVNSNMPEGMDSGGKDHTGKLISSDRQPDLVIPMNQSFEQYGLYLDQYQVFVLPTHISQDTWVDGIEFVPGNKKIVRFAGISVETSDKFDALDRWDPRSGYYSFGGLGKVPGLPDWSTWSLQQVTNFYPEGVAKFLPKNSKLILHVHYGPTGKPQTDSSFVRLYFSKNPIHHQVMSAPLINPYGLTNDSLFIAADTKKIFHASYTVPYDITILSLTPQANLLCRSWEVYALIPGDSKAIKLLRIKDWNFNWKQTYKPESPVTLPKGSVIHALAHFDNTTDNPCNPSEHPVPVSWGAHLFSEMFFVHFEFIPATIYASSFQLTAPVMVSDSVLMVNVSVDKKDIYDFSICNTEGTNCNLVQRITYDKGHYSTALPVANYLDGNYLLRVTDSNKNVMAEQLFIKIRENGM
jgi:hypothetical protein